MALARYQFTVVDDEGNVVPLASIEVRRERADSPIVSLYSDRDGATPLGNPFQADADGFAAFHVSGGAYRITATSGAFSREWRYVGIGLASESDSLLTGIAWTFSSTTTDSDPGPGNLRFNNATLASVTAIYLDNLSSLGATVSSWLDALDDNGTSADRGTIFLQTADATGLLIARVTGSVVDGTGYRKLTVTPITTAGTFASGATVMAFFSPTPINGINPGIPFTFSTTTSMSDPGAGTLRLNNATLASVTAAAVDDLSAASGNPDVSAWVLSWDDSTNAVRGHLILKDAAAPQNFAVYAITGASTDNSGWTQLALTHVTSAGSLANGATIIAEFARAGNVGADGTSSVGKQTIWVPASAMTPPAGGSPSYGVLSIASAGELPYLAFDAGTVERACFSVAMPKSWNEGSLTAKVYWAHPATTTNFDVVWVVQAAAFGNDDPLAVDVYTGVFVTDTGGTTSDLYISGESGSIDPGNTQAEGDLLLFRMIRQADSGSDTLAVDAYLVGVMIHYTTDAATDA